MPDREWAPQILRELASFSARGLKLGGVALVLCPVTRLREACANLDHKDIELILEFDFRFDFPVGKLNEKHGIGLRRMPLLVLGKPGFVLQDGDDVIQLPEVDGDSAKVSMSHRLSVGTDMILRRFTQPGDMICDPILFTGTTAALSAIRWRRRFVGGCHDGPRFQYVRDRLIREDERRENRS